MAPCKQVLTKTDNTFGTRKHTYIYDELPYRSYDMLLYSSVDHWGAWIANMFVFP